MPVEASCPCAGVRSPACNRRRVIAGARASPGWISGRRCPTCAGYTTRDSLTSLARGLSTCRVLAETKRGDVGKEFAPFRQLLSVAVASYLPFVSNPCFLVGPLCQCFSAPPRHWSCAPGRGSQARERGAVVRVALDGRGAKQGRGTLDERWQSPRHLARLNQCVHLPACITPRMREDVGRRQRRAISH